MATVKIHRSSAGLKDALFEAIEALRAGDIEPSEAQQIGKLANQIVSVSKHELEVVKFQMSLPEDMDIPALNMGVSVEPSQLQALPRASQRDVDADTPEAPDSEDDLGGGAEE